MKRRWRISLGIVIIFAMFFFGLAINYNSPLPSADHFSSVTPKRDGTDVITKIQALNILYDDRNFAGSDSCKIEFDRMYKELNTLKLDQFSLAEMKRNAPALIQESFNTRLAIRNNFQKAYFDLGADKISKPCAFAHRQLFRALRVFEDYLGMLHEDVFLAPGLPMRKDETFYRVFTGRKDNLINFAWNEKYKPADPGSYEPKSGDVLLSRGAASVSAAIARITDEDSNFSHAGIVYIDPATKKIETIEAHIEFGTLVAKIADYSDMKARSLVFRFRDRNLSDHENEQIAHEAAYKVRKEVLDYKDRVKNKPIQNFKYPDVCYDFGMKIDNPTNIQYSNDEKTRKCLFCSEVISMGYSLVAGGKYKIPAFMSPINPKNRKFLDDIGVEVTETFAPADIEIDPNFELVLEWRDYTRIHKTHIMDSILTSMYRWMDDYGYEFDVPIVAKVAANIGFVGRRIPMFDRWTKLDKKFPHNMKKEALYTMIMLDKVSNQLANVIEDGEKANGFYYTPAQMKDVLDIWRERDLQDFTNDKNYNSIKDRLRDHRIHHLLRAADKPTGPSN